MNFFNIFFPNDIEKSIESGNVRGIIRALRNPDPVVQRKSAAALADLTPHEAIRPLLHTLGSPDRDVRRLSAMALGNIGDNVASSGLVIALGDVDPRVRLEVAEALGKLSDPIAVDALLQCLDDNNADVRMNTIWALGRMHDEKVIPQILPLLANPDRGTRLRAAEALENLNGVPANPPDNVLYFIAKNKWDEIPQFRETAIEPLVWALNDDYYDIRMRAARTLGRLKGPVVVDALRRALFDPEECVSIEAVEALSNIGSDEAIHSLVDGLSSPNKYTGLLAGAALDRLGWKPTQGQKKIPDASAREEWDICSSLRGVPTNAPLTSKGSEIQAREFPEFAKVPKDFSGPTPERFPIQLHNGQTPPDTAENSRQPEISNDTRFGENRITISNELDKFLRPHYIQNFGLLKKPLVVDVLIQALETDDTVLLKEALRGLGAIKRPDSIASIARAARHPDKNVRLGAIVALGIISRKTGSCQFPAAVTGMAWEETQNSPGNRAAEALLELKRSSPLIEEMITALSHPYAYMRRGAADVLQMIGWKPGNDDEQILFNAAHPSGDEWINLLKRDPSTASDDEIAEIVANIIADMEDPRISPEKKRELVQLIGESGDVRYTDVLVAALQESDPSICREAMLACGKRGDPCSVPILIPLVKDPDPEVRKSAIETLGMIRDKSSIPPIVEAIHDDDPAIRKLAVETLGVFEDPLSVQALVMNFSHEDPLIRETLCTALNLLGDYALHQIKDFLTSDDGSLRSAAREVIMKNYGRTIALEFFIYLLSIPDKTIIREAACSLNELGLTLAADENFINYFIARSAWKKPWEMEGGFLIERLKDRNPEVRKSALLVLSHLKPVLNGQVLIPLLQDPDSDVRALVASNLEAIDWHPETEEQSIMYLFARKKWNELEKTGKTAVRVLTRGLTDRDPDVRRASAELLGTTSGENAVPALMEGLHDEDRDVRISSIKSLLKMQSGESSRLISCLKRDAK